MSAKTRIVVLHMKEIVYTAIFIVLAALLIGLLVLMFGSGKGADKEVTSSAVSSVPPVHYVAGVYTTPIELDDHRFDVQVTVDADHINAIELVHLTESTASMYPLMEPALEHLASQIYESQSTEHITYDDDSKYTSMLLLEAIRSALHQAVDSE